MLTLNIPILTLLHSFHQNLQYFHTIQGNVAFGGMGCTSDVVKCAAAMDPGQLWTSTNTGVTWTDAGVGSKSWKGVAVSSDASKALAVEGSNIWRSTDTFASWTSIKTESGVSWSAIGCNSDASKCVAASTNGKISYTVDGGTTWTLVTVSAGNEFA
jgi:photosystem II stability/assembly factor-like uncharacterized protein